MQNEVPNLITNAFIENEYGLQFELACYLRKNNYRVYFEKNINNKNTCKHEIDLVVEDLNTNIKYAIELKYPKGKNKGNKKEIYEFAQDIIFSQQLINLSNKPFAKTYCLTLVDSTSYCKKTKQKDPLWDCFAGTISNNQVIANKDLDDGLLSKTVKHRNGTSSTKTIGRVGSAKRVRWDKITNLNDHWYYIIENL